MKRKRRRRDRDQTSDSRFPPSLSPCSIKLPISLSRFVSTDNWLGDKLGASDTPLPPLPPPLPWCW